MQRSLRTRFDLLRPELEETVCQKQAKHKKDHDLHTRRREFFVGQRVLVRNLRDGPRWLQGTVIEWKGPLSYLVQLASGTVWKRHVDHTLESVDSPLEETVTPEPVTHELEELTRFPLSPNTPVPSPTVPVAEQPAITTDKASAPEHAPEIVDHQQPESVQTPRRRYPQCRHPPERFHDLTG